MSFVSLKRTRSQTLLVKLVLLIGVSFVPVGGIRASQQGESEKDEVVIAEGVGIDHSSALKDAFRNAVRQVVGGMLDAETVVQNDEAIEDKVLMFSDGLINSGYEELSSKTIDGLVRVKIKASVKRKSLSETLRSKSITSAKIDGRKLFAESATRLESENNAREMLKEHFEAFQSSVFDAELLPDPKMSRLDDSRVQVVWVVRIRPNNEKWKTWVSKAIPLIKGVASSSSPVSMNTAQVSTDEFGRLITERMFRYRYDEQEELERFFEKESGFFKGAELGIQQFQFSQGSSSAPNPPDGVSFVYLNEGSPNVPKGSKWRLYQMKSDLPVHGCRLNVQLRNRDDETFMEKSFHFSKLRIGSNSGVPGVFANVHSGNDNTYIISPGFMPDDDTYMSVMLIPAIFEMTPEDLASLVEARVSIESNGVLREEE